MDRFDTQGWIDAISANGRPYAFFVRNDFLWVRRDGEYKRTHVSGGNTIAASRALAAIIAGEMGLWMDKKRAIKHGLPSD